MALREKQRADDARFALGQPGMIECCDGAMSVADLVHIFDGVAHRRNAADHIFKFDQDVRLFILDLLRSKLPRHKREAMS
jgi:hypothetical protein